jgi:hypothetical protein
MSTVHHQQYLNTVYTAIGICHASSAGVWRLLADASRSSMYCCVYSVEILLMMDSGHVRNMYSTLSKKSEKQCISLAFIIRTRKTL